MKDRLASAAVAQPARTNRDAPRFRAFVPQFCRRKTFQAFGEVCKNFGGYLAAYAVWAQDARHRDARQFLVAHLFQNFEGEPLLELHSRGPQQRSNGFGGASLPSDYLAQILRMDAKFENRDLLTCHCIDSHFFGMIYECF